MNTELEALKHKIEQLEAGLDRERRRLRIQTALALCAVIGAILISPANRAAMAQGYGTTLQQLLNRITAVENKTRFVSIAADPVTGSLDMYLTGTNLHIVNGLGATNGNPAHPYSPFTTDITANGKGNLIIGYNEARAGVPFGGTDTRTGSHNLIVGIEQNYTSIGGINVGSSNTISGPYASVSGGQNNTASELFAAVSGGQGNMASGMGSSVSGGDFNFATGNGAFVIGGQGNTASGLGAAVSGGTGNTASGIGSSVSGGNNNTASGTLAAVSGGQFNTAGGDYASVSGGSSVTQNTAHGWSAGSGTGASVTGDFHSP